MIILPRTYATVPNFFRVCRVSFPDFTYISIRQKAYFLHSKQQIPYLCPINHKKAANMATNKDTENSTPSAPAPADNDIAKLTEVTEQDLAEAIIDEYGAKYSKDGKRLLEGPRYASLYNIKKGTEIIGNSAFFWCSSLTSITIPPSVTSIGNSAFRECSNLASIAIPPSVTSIGNSAFRKCSNLASIAIPPSVINIGSGVFSGCKSLTSITIPPSVRTMEGNPFRGWDGRIEIDSPYFKYEDGALIDVEKGILVAFRSNAESYTILPSVTTIGEEAWHSCKYPWLIFVV